MKRGQLLAQLDERELPSNRNAAQAGAQAAIAGVAQARKGWPPRRRKPISRRKPMIAMHI